MNFIAIIGIVEQLDKSDTHDLSTLKIKVEKPYSEAHDEDFYDIIEIKLDKNLFNKELNLILSGSVVGIKGRVKLINNNLQLIGERLQVF
jgi:hypothetical protein